MIQRKIILTAPAGQLGNRLLQMCSFIAFAKENNYTIINPGFDKFHYARYFDFTDKNILCSYPPVFASTDIAAKRKRRFNFYRFITEKPVVCRIFYTGRKLFMRAGILPRAFAVYLLLGTSDKCNLDDPAEPLLQQMRGNKKIFMGGWMFRAISSFDKYAGEFRKLFTPKQQYLDNIHKLITAARNDHDILVGVHIRHGDYKDHFGGIYYYELPQYKQKMRETLELFPGKRVCFLVCSTSTFTHTDFEGFDVIFGTGEQLEDMYSFAFCDYTIGPPSTFTGWASFWGQKPVHHISDLSKPVRLENFSIFNGQQFVNLDTIFFG
jgi:hypothetical protein